MKDYRLPSSDTEPFLRHLEEAEDAFLGILEAHPRLSRLETTATLLLQIKSLGETAKRFRRETE